MANVASALEFLRDRHELIKRLAPAFVVTRRARRRSTRMRSMSAGIGYNEAGTDPSAGR
jgi:hypothetical protein